MKVAVPLDENRTDVCPVLARAPFYLFWEDGCQSIEPNPAAQAQSGAGIQSAQFLSDSGISVLITPRCGQNAADIFSAAGIRILKSSGSDASENIRLWQDDGLEELTHFHGGFHGHR